MRLILTNINLGLWAAAYVKHKIDCHLEKRPFVMGLPTGGTVLDLYANLRLFHTLGELSFKNVLTFNLDEYVGLAQSHPQSYHSYMRQNLFEQIDLPPKNAHLLNGNATDLNRECVDYERAINEAGGMDLLLGGVGRNGHIAFNEPGSAFDTRTRVVDLTKSTREANARFFQNDMDKVPSQAVSMGIGTIKDAREILLLASGANKADAIKRLVEGSADTDCPVTALEDHPNAALLVDAQAISKLSKKTLAKLTLSQEESPEADQWMLTF